MKRFTVMLRDIDTLPDHDRRRLYVAGRSAASHRNGVAVAGIKGQTAEAFHSRV